MTSNRRLQLDPQTRRAWLDGRPLDLAGRSYELLTLLARQPGQLVEHRTLLRALWPGREISPTSLRMVVAALRRALGPAGIENVAGRGYALTLPVLTESPSGPGRPRDDRPGLLPPPIESLLGRDEDLAHLLELLSHRKLVTVLGPGGIGKTALALAAAWRYQQAGGRIAVAVDLAALQAGADAAALRDAVAQACGVQPPPASDTRADAHLALTLGTDPAWRDALLLLDNAEHVVAPLQPLVLALRTHAPVLRLLVTTQHALSIAGEAMLRLGTLDTPPPDAGPAEIGRCASVRLLIRRAQAAQPKWQPAEVEVPALAALARALDGVPLALEMAAVRLPLWGAGALQQRIVSQRLLIDRDEPRRAGMRHPNLNAALAWSFDCLSTEERSALQRLSVFAAPFRPASAVAVLAQGERAALAHERVLQQLVDHSMLQWQPPLLPAAAARLRMLEPVRWFASEALSTLGTGAVAEAQAAHGRALAALAQEACHDLLRSGDADWRARWLPDHEDFMRAFDLAHARGDAAVAGVVIEVLVQGANVTGHGTPALQRWQATRDLAERAAPIDRARLLGWGNHAGESAADRRAQSARRVAAWRALPAEAEQPGLCAAWAMHAVVCQETGDAAGADGALAACEGLEHPAWPARLRRRCVWLALTRLAIERADPALLRRAQVLSQQLLVELGDLGAYREVTLVQAQLATMLRLAGQHEAAIQALRRVAETQAGLGCSVDAGRSMGLVCAALVELSGASSGTPASGQWLAQAATAAIEALERVAAFPPALGYFIEAVAEIACRLGAESDIGADVTAATWLAAARHLRDAQQLARDALMTQVGTRVDQLLHARLDAASLQRCDRQGRLLTADALGAICLAWLRRQVRARPAVEPAQQD